MAFLNSLRLQAVKVIQVRLGVQQCIDVINLIGEVKAVTRPCGKRIWRYRLLQRWIQWHMLVVRRGPIFWPQCRSWGLLSNTVSAANSCLVNLSKYTAAFLGVEGTTFVTFDSSFVEVTSYNISEVTFTVAAKWSSLVALTA